MQSNDTTLGEARAIEKKAKKQKNGGQAPQTEDDQK